MKTRTGFVSNSSSSSFIVALDKPCETVKDVKKCFNCSDRYAKRLLEMLKSQEGIIVCNPPKPECDVCNKRFHCFTGRGYSMIDALRRHWGYRTNDEVTRFVPDYVSRCVGFSEKNKDKILYFLRFPDTGEGGDILDSEMRGDCIHLVKNVPFLNIT